MTWHGDDTHSLGERLDRPGRDAWEFRVSAGRDPVTKRYRYVSRSIVGTKKQAEAALAGLLTEVSTGTGGHKGADATVGELVEQWLDLRRETLSVTTWEAYCGKARYRLIPALGEIPVRVHRHVIPWRFRHGIPSLGVHLSSR